MTDSLFFQNEMQRVFPRILGHEAAGYNNGHYNSVLHLPTISINLSQIITFIDFCILCFTASWRAWEKESRALYQEIKWFPSSTVSVETATIANRTRQTSAINSELIPSKA